MESGYSATSLLHCQHKMMKVLAFVHGCVASWLVLPCKSVCVHCVGEIAQLQQMKGLHYYMYYAHSNIFSQLPETVKILCTVRCHHIIQRA